MNNLKKNNIIIASLDKLNNFKKNVFLISNLTENTIYTVKVCIYID
jgi:hypothetical protein